MFALGSYNPSLASESEPLSLDELKEKGSPVAGSPTAEQEEGHGHSSPLGDPGE